MLIAFEGLDQSGKATQSRALRARLEQDGRKTSLLSFPDYETPIGQELRRALQGEREFGPDVMQLLYIANRLEYRPRLEMWLQAGHVVVCDRYVASSLAYGEAQGLDVRWLSDAQRILPAADVNVFLDLAPEVGAARKRAGRDRYERDLAMLGRVRESYRRLATGSQWVVIDASGTKDEVSAAVEAAVLPRLERRSPRTRA